MIEYLQLMNRVLTQGEAHESRAGRTRMLFGEMLRLSLYNRFPLVTTRKLDPRPIWGELATFLTGSTELKTFKALGCNYWDANAEAWKPGEGSVGKIYGYQWRYWNGMHDQIAALLHALREDPHSRRHVVTAWNPSELHEMCLPPCHVMMQFNVEQAWLDCAVYMRSVDICLGLPADMVLYGTLLSLVANEVGLQPGQLVFFLGNAHVYDNHIELARVQLGRSAFPLPKLTLKPDVHIDAFAPEDCDIAGYDAHPAIKYPLNV